MFKSINPGKKYRLVISLSAVLFFASFRPVQKTPPEIVLQDEHLPVVPKEFYIADVIDDRADRIPVATLLPVNNQTGAYSVDLHGGAVLAVRQFIAHNLPVNRSLRPITIELKKFKLTESVIAGNKVEGHVSLILSFSLDRQPDDPLPLGNYNGALTYIRSKMHEQNIEPILRELLENGLLYINTWMDQQAGSNVKLTKAVKVAFKDYGEKPEGDTIYYAVNRPLKWSDFQSTTTRTGNRYEAEVFPTIGYDEHTGIKNGIINITLSIKAGLPKSACWVKEGSQNDYTLNHEQRHFDIVKLAGEHFKHWLEAEKLPVSNFDGTINVDYLDAYREMNNMQKQYDYETHHGTDHEAQQRWNEKIDKELKEYGIK